MGPPRPARRSLRLSADQSRVAGWPAPGRHLREPSDTETRHTSILPVTPGCPRWSGAGYETDRSTIVAPSGDSLAGPLNVSFGAASSSTTDRSVEGSIINTASRRVNET